MCQPDKVSLVLSGGGARGAYEAGVLHYLSSHVPESRGKINMYFGSSVGSINASFMAATSDDPGGQGKRLRELWESIYPNRVYRSDWKIPFSFVFRYLRASLLNRWGRKKRKVPLFAGLLDVDPLFPFLKNAIPFQKLGRNLKAGAFDALTIVSTNLLTGRPELFISKSPEAVYQGDYVAHFASIHLKHILASSSIPLLFPPVYMRGAVYADGSMRMSTPLSPAVQMGAKKILIIGTVSTRSSKASERAMESHNSGFGLVLGRVLNSLFLDKLEADLDQIKRINRILEAGNKACGTQFLAALNPDTHGDSAAPGPKRHMQKIDTLVVQPSRPLSELLEAHYDPRFFGRFKILTALLSPSSKKARDFLSYLYFGTEYLKALTAQGYRDAEAMGEQLVSFFKD